MNWSNLMVLGLAMISASPVTGETAGEFIGHCEKALRSDFVSNVDLLDAGMCMGRVSGVSDLMMINCLLALDQGTVMPPHVAARAETTLNAKMAAVVNFGRDNPQMWSGPPSALVAAALAQTWPCR
ncbi:Rap1a/Tai family immunity protein [Tropicimonas aquimaris]|uniref:Rap1a/Tai family immunity protein n=1 Tax=Tropicimonas aquimaris TaxID=914152 RepID=A0ABW3IKD1_9RHOB